MTETFHRVLVSSCPCVLVSSSPRLLVSCAQLGVAYVLTLLLHLLFLPLVRSFLSMVLFFFFLLFLYKLSCSQLPKQKKHVMPKTGKHARSKQEKHVKQKHLCKRPKSVETCLVVGFVRVVVVAVVAVVAVVVVAVDLKKGAG